MHIASYSYSYIKCHFYTLQNMTTHTLRGCTHHTLLSITLYIQPLLKSPSNKICALNFNFNPVIVLKPNTLQLAIASGMLQEHACHYIACVNVATHAYFHEGLHPPHLLFHLILYAFYQLAIYVQLYSYIAIAIVHGGQLIFKALQLASQLYSYVFRYFEDISYIASYSYENSSLRNDIV